MTEQIMKILADIRPDVDFEHETALIDDAVLDSFDLITIIGEFNEVFGIEIDVEDIEPANFNSAAAMEELIRRLVNEDD